MRASRKRKMKLAPWIREAVVKKIERESSDAGQGREARGLRGGPERLPRLRSTMEGEGA